MKKDDKVLVTLELDENIYFEMLKYCSDNRISLDDFVEQALKAFIEKYDATPDKKAFLKKVKKQLKK